MQRVVGLLPDLLLLQEVVAPRLAAEIDHQLQVRRVADSANHANHLMLSRMNAFACARNASVPMSRKGASHGTVAIRAPEAMSEGNTSYSKLSGLLAGKRPRISRRTRYTPPVINPEPPCLSENP